MTALTLKAAEVAGRIGTRNSAMPGTSFATSTAECVTGRKLSDVPGSVCEGCYAKKSEKMYPSVKQGWAYNHASAIALIATDDGLERWARFMAFQIQWHAKRLGELYHRWYDAGDLQSVRMLQAIVRVCQLTPEVRHWLPTREAQMVAQWRREGGVEPDNLVIRISSTMIGDRPRRASHTSTVHMKGTFDAAVHRHDCPKANHTHASNSCEKCRNCWDKSIDNVSYQYHR